MKHTVPLKVLKSLRVSPTEFTIHPNDGFDIGLMTTHYNVDFFHGLSMEDFSTGKGTGFSAQLRLLNECPKEGFEIHPKVWEKMGCPAVVILIADGTRILVQGK